MQLIKLIIIYEVLKYTIASPTNHETISEDLTFNCGYITFQDRDVRLAANAAKQKLNKKLKFPMLYTGPLYDHALEYKIWPILADGQIFYSSLPKGNFYIVLDSNSDVVDILAILADNQLTKCKKIGLSSQYPSELWPEESTGFNCGHEFFEDEMILENFNWARSNIDTNYKYPVDSLVGNLYNPQHQYLIWPISKRNVNGISGRLTTNTYFVVLTTTSKFVWVVAKLRKGENFIECQRDKNFIQLPSTSEVETDINSEIGYQCGLKFFELSYLQTCIKSSLKSTRDNKKNKYPQVHIGPPFDEKVWIWPIFPNKKIYYSGSPGYYFLVMNEKFDLISVVAKHKKQMHKCVERFKYLEEANKEIDDFVCAEEVFNASLLQHTAAIACKRLHRHNLKYPKVYEGPDFDVSGPYYMYPLHLEKNFYRDPGKFRVVINPDCQVAGALFYEKNEIFKCKRSKDGSIPGGESVEKIHELEKKSFL